MTCVAIFAAAFGDGRVHRHASGANSRRAEFVPGGVRGNDTYPPNCPAVSFVSSDSFTQLRALAS